MTSQKLVREVFNLPQKENIFDDFGCALLKNILLHGRMFLTENYICFYSNVLGFTHKQIISIADVVRIVKKRSLGLFPNALELECTDGKKYFFCSFISRESAYKCVLALWKNVSPHASAFESDLEDDEEDDEETPKEAEDTRTTFVQKPEEDAKGTEAPLLPPEELKGEE